MKRVSIWLISLCIVMVYTVSAQAGLFGSKKKVATTPAKETAAKKETPAQKEAPKAAEAKKPEVKISPEVQKKSLDAQRLLAQEKRKKINNTEWEIELRTLSGSAATKEKEKKEVDLLIFKDNQVSVQTFSKKGFGSTNFTLTVQDDGSCVWETMQTSEKSGVAFWRGEIDKDTAKMQGVLSYHIDDKTTREYSFINTSKTDIPAQPQGK
jgi:hypothetical protein